MTLALAIEWAKHNIKVNAIAPSYVITEMIMDLVKRGLIDEKKLIERTALKRLATLEDVSKAALFLALDESDYVTGEILRVDGGWGVP